MSKYLDKLRDKKIAVVGGSSGIGFGAAQALLELGANVVIISSSEQKLVDAVKRLKSITNREKVTGVTGDARDEEALTQVLIDLAPLDHIVFSSVDKLIRGPLSTLDLTEAKHLFGVKFWGSIVVGKALLKHDIVRPGGSLTLTSGMAALKPGNLAAVGSALNGGLLSFNKGLAAELAEKRIRVNTVIPGLVKTELWDSNPKKEDVFEAAAKKLPVGFIASPEDIAEAYVYLIRANFATGTLVQIDGGSLL